MKLHDAMTPSSLRVQVFLAEKGIEVPIEPVDVLGGGTRTPEFLALNPFGEVPLLELDDGSHLTETVAICRLFEELHPEPALMGTGAKGRARIEMWNRRMEQRILDTIGDAGRHRLEFFADKVEQVPAYADTQMRLWERNLGWLDGELADGRSHVAESGFSIADITGMSMLFICDIMQTALPEKLSNVRRWAEAMRARPSFAARFAEAA